MTNDRTSPDGRMSADEIARLGLALYGPDWRPRMAQAVGVCRSTAWKWAAGRHPVPEPVARLIRGLATAAGPTPGADR